MTRQMADDEVLRILDAHIKEKGEYARFASIEIDAEIYAAGAEELLEVRAAVAALQAERDALRADVETYQTNLTEESSARFDAEHALEALRGQVEGLVGGLRTQADRAEQRSEQKFAEGVADIAAQESGCAMTARHCAAHLDALLAIKERMG